MVDHLGFYIYRFFSLFNHLFSCFPVYSSTPIHKSIPQGTRIPPLGTLLTHSYLSGTGIYATAMNRYYNSIILAMTQNTAQIPGFLDSR